MLLQDLFSFHTPVNFIHMELIPSTLGIKKFLITNNDSNKNPGESSYSIMHSPSLITLSVRTFISSLDQFLNVRKRHDILF